MNLVSLFISVIIASTFNGSGISLQVLAAPTRVTSPGTKAPQGNIISYVILKFCISANHLKNSHSNEGHITTLSQASSDVRPRSYWRKRSPTPFKNSGIKEVDARALFKLPSKKGPDRWGIISGCGGRQPSDRAGILRDCNISNPSE